MICFTYSNISNYIKYWTISNTSSRNLKNLLISHQSKYMYTKFRIELYSKLKLEILLNFLHETMNILGRAERRITKKKKTTKGWERAEINEVVLVHCNIVKNEYQCDTKVLRAFVSNTSFSQLLNISLSNHNYSEAFPSEFSHLLSRWMQFNRNTMDKFLCEW